MSFEDDFDIEGEIFADIQKVQRVAALTVLNEVIKNTPVDSGEARGGWQVAVGKSTRKERSKLRRASGALTEGISIIKKGTASVKLQDLFITNLKPYIVRLENGWSDQSSHFVAAAVQKAGLGDVKLG